MLTVNLTSRRDTEDPIFVAKHKGQWRWSKPDKGAFEKALKFIEKQSKWDPRFPLRHC